MTTIVGIHDGTEMVITTEDALDPARLAEIAARIVTAVIVATAITTETDAETTTAAIVALPPPRPPKTSVIAEPCLSSNLPPAFARVS